MEKTRITLSKRDLENILKVIEWGMSDYDDVEHVAELEKLYDRITRSHSKLSE
jgi:hypothetical protein